MVAQVFNLPYRRLAVGWTLLESGVMEQRERCRLQTGDTADCKSALRLPGSSNRTHEKARLKLLNQKWSSSRDFTAPSVAYQ